MTAELSGDKGLKAFLTDLLLPNRCPFCGGFILYSELICSDCSGDMLWADDKICPVCGKDDCICGEGFFCDRSFVAAYYAGKVREGIFSLKYEHSANAFKVFGNVLGSMLTESGAAEEACCIVPVPMSRREERRREGNHAVMLANAISRSINLPVSDRLLTREYSKISQHQLSYGERKESVISQYGAKEEHKGCLTGKTVILCDDVITTGSTVNRCAELLKTELGAEKVYAALCATVSLDIR